MASSAIVFASKKAAESALSRANAALGYPRPGMDIGGGVHAPPEKTITVACSEVVKHSSKNEYAIVSSEEVDGVASYDAELKLGRRELDLESWDPGRKDRGAK